MSGRQWCSGRASRTKGPGFESRVKRILPMGFSTEMASVTAKSPGRRHRARLKYAESLFRIRCKINKFKLN